MEDQKGLPRQSFPFLRSSSPPTGSNKETRQVLVVGDNIELARLIAFQLQQTLGLQVQVQESGLPVLQNGYHLLILALAHPYSEPLVLLSRKKLLQWMGKVPLLIIHNELFQGDSEHRIFSLPFPFEIDVLVQTVKQILSG